MIKELELIPWLAIVKNEKTRPKYIIEIDDKLFDQPFGMVASVYRYTNLLNGKIYIGIHLESHKPYHTSSQDEDFLKDKADKDAKFKFEILDWGSYEECIDIEHNLLKEVDAKNNPLYYNKSNGRPGTPKKDLKFQNQLTKELKIIRTGKTDSKKLTILSEKNIASEESFIDLFTKRGLFQVRDTQIDDDNVDEIEDKIQYNYGVVDYPIYLKDRNFNGVFYEWLLISGNHTIYTPVKMGEHFQFEKTEQVIIPPEIHKKGTDSDWRAIANNLNVKIDSGKKYDKWDARKEAIDAFESGNSYGTLDDQERWRNNGIITKHINWILKELKEYKEEKISNGKGETRVNYSTPEGKALLKKKYNERSKDGRLILDMASGTPSLHRLINIYIEKQKEKYESGEPLYNEIYVLVHHKSRKAKSDFASLQKQVLGLENLKNDDSVEDTFKEELLSQIKTPKIEFEELPLYMKDSRLKGLLN